MSDLCEDVVTAAPPQQTSRQLDAVPIVVQVSVLLGLW